ncbi:MAG: hypothetical protein E2O82_05130 [Betaproteobacteria bacterium]|nr:MAG: hypothetical protein E2O82_05130 [Betaproteobacteria bacterium]
MIKRNITHVYRQEAGEGKDGTPAVAAETPPVKTAPAVETPPVEAPPAAATPPVETPPAPPPADDGTADRIPEENLWDTLSKDTDDDGDLPEEVDSTPPAPEEVPPKPAVEEPPPPAEPPAAEASPVEPVVPPVETPPTPEVQPTPVPPEPPAPTEPSADELAAADTKAREEMQDKIAKHYPLSEADSLQLLSDPGKFLPKYQARMWTDMWFAMHTMISDSMPNLIQSNLREVEEQKTHVDTFFKAWPKLNQKDHGKTVAQVSQVYSQVNPNATAEEVTKFVGMQVMLHHGIAPDLTPVDIPPGTPPTPEASPPVQQPFQPAAVNSAPAEQQSESGNIYTSMSEELLEDDLK